MKYQYCFVTLLGLMSIVYASKPKLNQATLLLNTQEADICWVNYSLVEFSKLKKASCTEAQAMFAKMSRESNGTKTLKNFQLCHKEKKETKCQSSELDVRCEAAAGIIEKMSGAIHAAQ